LDKEHGDFPEAAWSGEIERLAAALGCLDGLPAGLGDPLGLLAAQQMPARHEQVSQCAGDEQAVGILLQPAIAHQKPKTSRPSAQHRVYPLPVARPDHRSSEPSVAADITYIPVTRGLGFLYLVVVMDW